MDFTPSSEKLLSTLIDNFDDLRVKRTRFQQKQVDNVVRILYSEIKAADRFVNLLWSLGKVHRALRARSATTAPPADLLASRYVPPAIREHIKENLQEYLVFETELGGRRIEILFGILSDKDRAHLGRLDRLARKMITWLKIASTYSPRHCSTNLRIFCFMTPFKKKLPDSQFKVLDASSCNSAVTTSCIRNGEVLVYRREEFFKVFVHETFHVLGLDFSSMPDAAFRAKAAEIFPIKSEFRLYEAYAEFWACTLNALFCAFSILGEEADWNNFILYSDFCLRFEQIFSILQCVKVLDFMGMHYTHLYDTDSISQSIRKYLFKEKSNVFAYYVVKTILLYYNGAFMHWCWRNNTNLLAFNNNAAHTALFLSFIRRHYKKEKFLEDIVKGQRFLKTMKKEGGHSDFSRTLRMTLCETG